MGEFIITNKQKMLVLFIASVIIALGSANIGMFWDNVLFVSKTGTILYNNGIFNWIAIPVNLDPGHPPFIGTIMAAGWTMFGRTLAISHMLMLPFIFGLFWQISYFINYFIKNNFSRVVAFIMVIADPTLLSNLILVNPELILLFFFFLAINSILHQNYIFKLIALFFLGIVSYRGMMLCAGVFLIDIIHNIIIKKEKIQTFLSPKTIALYITASLPAIIYLIWRLINKGWITSNPLQLWGNAWEFSSFLDFVKNFLRNILILVHTLSDFGRIIPILFIIVTLALKHKSIDFNKYKTLLIIIFFSSIVIYTTALFMKNTIGHRYFIVSYLPMALLAFLLLNEYKIKKILYALLLSSLILGNSIVYPDSFAQGWDSSLAHIPYWKIRKEAIKFLDQKKIPVAETATFFPNKNVIDNIDLNGDMRSFINFTGTEKYVFYSNVYNLTDKDILILSQDYKIIKSFKKCQIRIEIYEKKR